MKEWIMENFDAAVITAICSLGTCLCTAIIGLVNSIKSRRNSKIIENAAKRLAYTTCPHCKKKISLSELTFYRADGRIDNNLNDVPDDEE